jgi:hypothetical protein
LRIRSEEAPRRLPRAASSLVSLRAQHRRLRLGLNNRTIRNQRHPFLAEVPHRPSHLRRVVEAEEISHRPSITRSQLTVLVRHLHRSILAATRARMPMPASRPRRPFHSVVVLVPQRLASALVPARAPAPRTLSPEISLVAMPTAALSVPILPSAAVSHSLAVETYSRPNLQPAETYLARVA